MLKYISIMDIVKEIRKQRNRKAIKLEQYVFIYNLLKEELKEPMMITHILSEREKGRSDQRGSEKMSTIINCMDYNFFDMSELMLHYYFPPFRL